MEKVANGEQLWIGRVSMAVIEGRERSMKVENEVDRYLLVHSRLLTKAGFGFLIFWGFAVGGRMWKFDKK